MDPSQENSREHLQQAIDAEIKSLEESIRVLRLHRNALAPISSLPAEVITTIFSILRIPISSSPLTPLTPCEKPDHLPWLRITHVCHHWREIALNQPRFWSHLRFSNFSSAGAAEILARAKTVPLHWEAKVPAHWDDARFSAFQKELYTHASHICHLDISVESFRFPKMLEGLVSPAPTLEYLSLEGFPTQAISPGIPIPDTLFDGTTPRLSCFKLRNFDISWKSPLLKGLRYLEIHSPSADARPSLSVWLDALDEMPQLKMLILYAASPVALPAPLPSGIKRAITLSSLASLESFASARDCVLALAHLILPALTRLCVIAGSHCQDGSDVQEIIPYVSLHARGFQHTQPLQSMIVRSNRATTNVVAWAVPDIDVKLLKPLAFLDDMHSAPMTFSFTNKNWSSDTHTAMFDAAMAALPLDSLVTLASQNHRNHFDKQVWLHHAPRWPLLRHVHLSPSVVRGFTEMLLGDSGGRESPLLPLLTKITLIRAELSARRTSYLCDALMKRVEQGVPLEALHLQSCLATSRAVDLLNEIVVDVLGPTLTLKQRAHTNSIWDDAARGTFVEDNSTGSVAEDYDYDDPLDTGSDDEVAVWYSLDIDDDDDDQGEYDEDEEENW